MPTPIDHGMDADKLLQAAVAGHPEAIHDLCQLLWPEVAAYLERRLPLFLLRRSDASDIAQETMLLATQHLHQFAGRTVKELRAWLRKSARRQAWRAVRHSRSKRRSIARELPLDRKLLPIADLAAHHRAASSDEGHSELIAILQAAMDRLSVEDQEIIGWRFSEDAGIEVIAARLQINLPAARKRLQRALGQLRQELERRDIE